MTPLENLSVHSSYEGWRQREFKSGVHSKNSNSHLRLEGSVNILMAILRFIEQLINEIQLFLFLPH